MATDNVIAFELKAGGFLFGRVLDGDAVFGAAALIVTYDFVLPEVSMARAGPEMIVGNLLIPPVNVGYLALKSGLARTVANIPPVDGEIPDPALVIRLSADGGPEAVVYVPEEKSLRMRDRSREACRVFDLDGNSRLAPEPPFGHVGGASGLMLNDASYAALITRAMASIRRMTTEN